MRAKPLPEFACVRSNAGNFWRTPGSLGNRPLNVRRITTGFARMRSCDDDLPERIERMGQELFNFRECLSSAFIIV